MKQRGVIVILVSVLLAASSMVCSASGWQAISGSGRVIEEEREVSGFTGVRLATFGDLYIEVGEKEELRIEAEDNLLQYFESEVDNGTLEIKTRPSILLHPTKPVNFYLTVKELDTIVLSGSGDIEAPDMEAEQICVKISGSGDVEMGDLSADVIKVQVTGSGNLGISESVAREQQVTISGSGDVGIGYLDADVIEVQVTGSGNVDISDGAVEEQAITISGSGDYEARNVESAKADVRISGSGSAIIWVRDRLDITISGSGDTYYVGRPAISQTVTGSGDVEQIRD